MVEEGRAREKGGDGKCHRPRFNEGHQGHDDTPQNVSVFAVYAWLREMSSSPVFHVPAPCIVLQRRFEMLFC